MACFLVPLTEALLVTAVKAAVSSRHRTDDLVKASRSADADRLIKSGGFKEKVGWLQKMLFGGSALLAVEHIYHGEVVLYPPFLTAMNSAEEIPVMLHEMATVGVGMAVLTTAVWAVMLAVSKLLEKKGSSSLAGGLA